MQTPQNETYPLVIFDGVCILCNGFIQFILKNDRKKYFRFTAIESATGKTVLSGNALTVESISLRENGKLYQKSSAALRIFKKLDGLYPLLYGFIIVPPFIRDFVYDIIARNRYKWFGKKDQCMIPDPSVKERFLD